MLPKVLLRRDICQIGTRLLSTSRKSDIKVDILEGKHKGIYVLSFDRPAVRNAVSRNTVKQLSETLDELSCDNEARVIILHSTTPGIFCSGADLKERQQLSPAETYRTVSRFRALTNQLESTPIPTIAAVDGFALGGGFEIALACDIRVASTEARFGLVETKLAIIPGAGGTQRLPRIVGPAIAKELIFTGRIIDAETAHGYGIVSHVVVQSPNKKAAFKTLTVTYEYLLRKLSSIEISAQNLSRT
jgi:methylglutaconyl-CoA hydratase